MNKLSELLHREIWSKRTSKIICLVVFGLVGIFLVGEWLNEAWVTPPERHAALAALKEIEPLRNAQGLDEAEYANQLAIAKAAVTQCEAKHFTFRDQYVAWEISSDLDALVLIRKWQQSPNKDLGRESADDKPGDAEKRWQQGLAAMQASEVLSRNWIDQLLGIKKN